jgi:hypothetical protein
MEDIHPVHVKTRAIAREKTRATIRSLQRTLDAHPLQGRVILSKTPIYAPYYELEWEAE